MAPRNAKNSVEERGFKVFEHRIRRSSFTVKHKSWVDHLGAENTAIELSVMTPWGKGTAHFPNCGETDWREWLADIGSDYIGSKLFGFNTRKTDYRKTLSVVRGSVNEMRAEGKISVAIANEIRMTLREHYQYKPDEPEDQQVSSLVHYAMTHAFLKDCGNPVQYSENPKFRAFCRHAWAPFTEYLQAELDRERALQPIMEVSSLVDTVEPDHSRSAYEPEMEP